MKAVVNERFGGPEVLDLRDVPVPAVTGGRVRLRVQATGLNPLDWHFLRGEPWLMRLAGAGLREPKRRILGSDVAGVVEQIGGGVTDLSVGDEVFGWAAGGGLAESVVVDAENLLPRPEAVSAEQAAGVPIAGFTALQALRDHGRLRAGQRVLVIGASGGVGTFAVQIAKAMGAHVTGVCSTRNLELVRSIGADEVVDYTVTPPGSLRERFDLVLHVAGNTAVRRCLGLLAHGGALVDVGANVPGRLLGPARRLAATAIVGRISRRGVVSFLAKETRADGLVLLEMLQSGEVVPVVDRTYPLADAAEAMRYLETGHARGKVVVTV